MLSFSGKGRWCTKGSTTDWKVWHLLENRNRWPAQCWVSRGLLVSAAVSPFILQTLQRQQHMVCPHCGCACSPGHYKYKSMQSRTQHTRTKAVTHINEKCFNFRYKDSSQLRDIFLLWVLGKFINVTNKKWFAGSLVRVYEKQFPRWVFVENVWGFLNNVGGCPWGC